MPALTPLSWMETHFPAGQLDPTKRRLELEWWMNLAFFAGQHFIEARPHSLDMQIPEVPRWRIRYVANHLWSKVLRIVGRQLRSEPSWLVGPNSTEPEDQRAAKVGEKVLIDFYRDQQMIIRQQIAALWAALCGTSFFQVSYEPQKGPVRRIYLDPETKGMLPPELERFIEPEMKEVLERNGLVREFPMGSAFVDVVNPFSVFVDRYATCDEDARYLVKATIRTVDEIEERYGVRVSAESPASLFSDFQLRLLSMVPGVDGSFLHTASAIDDKIPRAVVKEAWTRPESGYPKGRQFAVAGGVVLHELDRNPWLEFGELSPLIKHGFSPYPGRYWWDSYASAIRPLNLQFDKLKSFEMEAVRLMAHPKWFVPKGSEIAEDAITTEPGEVVEYNPAFGPPTPIAPDVNLAVFEAAQASVLLDMDRVGSEEEVARGEAPGSVRSGLGIARLEDRNDLVLWHASISMREAMRRVGRLILHIANRYYTEDRLLKIVGQDMRFEVSTFRGSDLRAPFDVRVEIDTFRSQSKAAIRQQIIELVQGGVVDLTKPGMQARILELLDIGDLRSLLLEQNLDRRRAQIENELLMQGNQVAVMPFDDHAVHAEEHLVDLLKTDRFEKADPLAKERALDHWRVHVKELEAQRQALLEEALAVKGTPGAKGSPSPPRPASVTPA